MAIDFQKLTVEQLETVRGPRNSEVEEQMQQLAAYMAGLNVGEGGAVKIDGLKRQSVRNRINQVAAGLGVKITVKKGQGDTVVFVVNQKPEGLQAPEQLTLEAPEAPEGEGDAPTPEPDATPSRRRRGNVAPEGEATEPDAIPA